MAEITYEELRRQRDLMLQENAELREKQRWIPVTERMPESGERCLLSCEIRSVFGKSRRRYVCDGYYAARWTIEESGCDDSATEYSEEKDEYFLLEGWYEVIKNWDDYGSVVIGDFVTHWMPLPEPPEVGE